jgi:type I restriction enzyme S subunit
MLDSILPTPVKLTHSEILFSAAATLAFQVIEKGGRPIIRLSRLCEKPQYGYTASAQAEGVGPRFLRITDIKAGSVDWKNVPYCDCPEPKKYLLKPGDILVARSGSVGKSFLVSECPEPTVFASYMIRMRAKPGVLAGYVYWYLQTQQFWFQIKESKRGSAMKNINSKMLSSARIPDATPYQQRAVVSFLTWFQNRIDGDYKTPPPEVPELLDVPRIVARIEELAALIEEAHGLRVKAREEAEALVGSVSSQLFNTVATMNPKHLIGETFSFRQDLIRPSDGKSGPLRFIGLQHIEPNTGKRIGEDRLLAEELGGRKFRFSSGEIVYGYLRPYLNKVWIADCEGVCSVDQYVIQPKSEIVDTGYLAHFMRSPIFLKQAIELTHNLLLPRLRTGLLESIPIPLPPLDEQRRIVAYLDDLQAQEDELTALQDATQAELDALLPSVLDRAFRGEL